MIFAGCGGNTETEIENEEGTEDGACYYQFLAENEEKEQDSNQTNVSALELLQNIIDEANTELENGEGLPEVNIDAITAENSPAMLGMIADDFASFAQDGAAAVCESDMIAFQAAVVICRDVNDAAMIDKMIQEGFDPGKWVYVFPDRALTVVSGPFIMLAVGSEAEADALANAFNKAIGGSSGAAVFYEGETGG